MSSILVLNGPNLNLLGSREPDVYGHDTLDSITAQLQSQAQAAGFSITSLQSNSEAELIDCIHASRNSDIAFLLFNPGAFTHTSIALRDAILGVELPFIECHLSNVYRREAFRHKSYFSDIALGVITGFGAKTYSLALDAAIHHLQQTAE
jgi:3-dehydroquinate dehydratase-2